MAYVYRSRYRSTGYSVLNRKLCSCKNIFVGTLDPRKLIEMNINHTNNFHMKISRITVIAVRICIGNGFSNTAY